MTLGILSGALWAQQVWGVAWMSDPKILLAFRDLAHLSVAYSLPADRRLARQESGLSGDCRVYRRACHVFLSGLPRLSSLNRMQLALVGVSHKTAPVEVRERLAFPSDKIRAALASLLERTHAAEAMILSTCNRVEIVAPRGPTLNSSRISSASTIRFLPTPSPSTSTATGMPTRSATCSASPRAWIR